MFEQFTIRELLDCISGITPDVQPAGVGVSGDGNRRCLLQKRLPPRKRNAVQQRIPVNTSLNLVKRYLESPAQVMSFRVVTTRAAVFTTLKKYRQSKSLAVNDRIVNNPRDSQ